MFFIRMKNFWVGLAQLCFFATLLNTGCNATFTSLGGGGVEIITIHTPPAINQQNQSHFTVDGGCTGVPDQQTIQVTVKGGSGSLVLNSPATCLNGVWSTTLDLSQLADQVAISIGATLGNGTGAKTAPGEIVVKKTDLPVVTITTIPPSVINQAVVTAVAVAGTCSGAEEGQAVTFKVGSNTLVPNSPILCASGSWSGTLDLSSQADGTVTVTTTLTDAEGNSSTPANLVFNKKSVPPQVALTSPAASSSIDGANQSTTFAVSGTCDTAGQTVQVKVDGAAAASQVGGLCNGVTWSATIDTTALSSGSHSFGASLSDSAGNSSSAATVAISRSTAMPAAVVPNATVTASGTINLSWPAATGAASYTVKIGTASGVYGTTYPNQATLTKSITGLVDGTPYFIQILANNAFGSTPLASEITATPNAAPAAFTISSLAVGNTQLTATWNASARATRYDVKFGTSSGVYTTTFGSTAATTLPITGLTNNTLYYVMVTAVNSTGSTNATAQFSATPIPLPGTFTASSPSTASGQINLSWTAASGATLYNYRYGTSSGVYGIPSPDQAGTTATISGLVDGTTYYILITAKNAAGNSTATEITAKPCPVPGVVGFVAAGAKNGGVDLSWTAASSATSYQVSMGTSPGSHPTLLGSTALTTQSVTGLTNGTTYYFLVTALNSSGNSVSATEFVATPGQVPAAFTGSAATPASGEVDLSWVRPNGEDSCDISRGTSSGSYPTSVATNVTALTFNDTGLSNGTTYYYRITAHNAVGNRVITAEIVATPSASSGITKLEVPIELLDVPSTGSGQIVGSATSLDTNDYDGTVSYVFEMVASNANGSVSNVELRSGAATETAGAMSSVVNGVPGTVVATIGLAASSTKQRVRTTFTPTSGLNIYFLQVGVANVTIYEARILVQQVNPTKTKLFIPLTSKGAVGGSIVDQTGSTTYAKPNAGYSNYLWKKENAKLATLAAGAPWQFEAVGANSAGSQKISLFNSTSGNQVAASELTIGTTGQVTFVRSSFADNTTDFTDGSEFDVRFKNPAGSSNGANLFKTGLGVKLTNLNSGGKTQSYYRVAQAASSTGGSVGQVAERTLIDLSLFSGPSAYYEVTADSPFSSMETTYLQDVGTSDADASDSPAQVSGSLLDFASVSPFARKRSGSLTLTSGHRFNFYSDTNVWFTGVVILIENQ